ncbi:MAG: cupin domain-containing protein [Methanothrix sp.]|nr:cupin domain-containing protein [Methanothrix sp.]
MFTSLPHRLKTSSEVYFILVGEGEMHIDSEKAQVRASQAILIPPGSWQHIRNTGGLNLEFICLVNPSWRAEDEEVKESETMGKTWKWICKNQPPRSSSDIAIPEGVLAPTDSNICIAFDLKTVPTTMLNRMVLLFLSILLALAATGVAAVASQDAVSEDSIKGNSSYNNSSISYDSSHPIAVDLGIGSRTELANANSATSMCHEVGFAREVSGRTEYAASSTSSQGEYESINSATTHMQIDETVTSGRVHIGVLSGDGSAGKSGNRAADPMSSAWKNPAIEIEEEYIGTYHISKNFTINDSYSKKSFADGWLSCCGGSYVTYLPEPVSISADDIFNCLRCNHRSR